MTGAPSSRSRPLDPRLLRYARASRPFFIAITAIGLAQTAVIVAFAWLLTRAIVGAIDGMDSGEFAVLLAALAAVAVARSLLLWAREAVAARAAARVQSQLRAGLMEAIDVLGPGWLARANTAQLAVTAGRGLEALDAYFGRYLPQLVQTMIATPLLIAVMWWQDWISGLTVLVTIPLIPIFMILIGWVTRAVQNAQWNTLRHLAARFSDTVQGLSTLIVFGRQHRAVASIRRVTETYRAETMRVLRVSFISGFALEFLASISVAIVAVSIGFRLLDGSLLLMVGLFVLLLAPEAYLPLRQVGVQFHAAAEGVAATTELFVVLDAARERAAASFGSPVSRGTASGAAGSGGTASGERSRTGGELLLHDVGVHRDDLILPPVSLALAPGRIVLVEGPSGSGKSSLLAALRGAAGFDGAASVDGVDIAGFAPSDWLAWAGQQPGLIAGTIADNVALGDPSPDAGLIRHALDGACADDLSPDLELGVQGAGLSGGQAQRVAVARALYRYARGHARVIALDEPSAALDAGTEARLWRSLRAQADAGAAILLVSHRTSARSIADDVIVLSERTAVA